MYLHEHLVGISSSISYVESVANLGKYKIAKEWRLRFSSERKPRPRRRGRSFHVTQRTPRASAERSVAARDRAPADLSDTSRV